jgi:hypothetical protein
VAHRLVLRDIHFRRRLSQSANVPFVAAHPEHYLGRSVESGHCVPFVCAAANVPHTSLWRRGDPVATTDVPTHTAIATFDSDGRYGNHEDGRSHAAIFVQQHGHGIRVWDCWLGQLVQQRLIRWKDGVGKAADDASRYHVIEVEAVPDD